MGDGQNQKKFSSASFIVSGKVGDLWYRCIKWACSLGESSSLGSKLVSAHAQCVNFRSCRGSPLASESSSAFCSWDMPAGWAALSPWFFRPQGHRGEGTVASFWWPCGYSVFVPRAECYQGIVFFSTEDVLDKCLCLGVPGWINRRKIAAKKTV